MRVTAGSAKGRPLFVPKSGVRPTAGRVKEAMFSILGANMSDLNVLDAFSGSGSLGIEALSRGADHCVFVDSDRIATQCAKKNLTATRLSEKANVVTMDVFRYLGEYSFRPFDLLLMDPPYEFSQEHILKILRAVSESSAVDDRSRFMLEVGKRVVIPTVSGLALVNERLYGDTKLVMFESEVGSH